MYVGNDPPSPSGVAHLLSPDIQRHPHEDDCCGNSGHDAIGSLVPRFLGPSVCVKRQEKAKKRLEAHHAKGDLSGDRSIGIDHVDQRDVGPLHDREIHYNMSDQIAASQARGRA